MDIEKRYDRIYTVLAFLAMYFVASSFIVPAFIALDVFFGAIFGAVFVLAVMLAGYFLQAIMCRLTKFERRGNDRTYESTVRYFSLGRATPIIALALFTVLFGSGVFKSLYLKMAQANHDILYDPNSLLPYLLAIVIGALLIFGSVIWFYPYRRFALLRVPMTCIPILMISFFFASQFGAAGSVLSALCLFGYIICTMILINQSTVTGCCGGFDSVSFLNSRARAYNALMTLSLLVVFGTAALILFIIMGGLLVIGRFLLVIFFLATNKPGEPNLNMPEYDLGAFVLGETAKEKAANSTVFTVFLGMCVVAILIMLMRRSSFVKDLIVSVKRWLSELFDFFFAFADRRGKKNTDSDEGFRSYKDEERRKQRAKISPYSKKIASTKTYKDFLAKLGSFKDSREKLGFAYASLVSRLIGAQKFVRVSDTPREIARKLEGDPMYEGIDGITEAFEIASYSDHKISDSDSDAALSTLCELMKKHLD